MGKQDSAPQERTRALASTAEDSANIRQKKKGKESKAKEHTKRSRLNRLVICHMLASSPRLQVNKNRVPRRKK